ncbi:MAG: DUF2298 domain-containing protein, partial [Anaerolineales bacterium]
LWYLTVSLLGLLTFPLAYRLFPALTDRGYSLSRALGLLLWGFLFWLMASLQIVRNDVGGVLLALAAVAGLAAWALAHIGDNGDPAAGWNARLGRGWTQVTAWVRDERRAVMAVEIIFLLFFAFMALVRAANPESTGTEKPMEQAFINAILRSETFPPRDPWLSGFAISYYYFGYVMTALLALFTGTPGNVAFNLMLALLFGLNATGSFGVVYTLLARLGRAEKRDALGLGVLGPLFLLLVGNLGGLLAMLHRRGLLWSRGADGALNSPFWTWLNIRDWNEPPLEPFAWVPDRFWWWWRPSRVINEFDLGGGWHEVISEFPAFSYVLGDLHSHVLAMPFALLLVGMALNLALGGWRGETRLPLLRLPVRPDAFAVMAMALGGMAFLNTWDFPIYAALLGGAFVLWRVRQHGWGWARGEELLRFALPLGVLSIVLYLPFYIGFASQAGGLLPNLVAPTRGAHLWVMFATLFVPLFASLAYLWRGEGLTARWRLGAALTGGFILLLWAFSWLLAWVVSLRVPEIAAQFLTMNAVPDLPALFAAATARRFAFIGGLLTIAALLTAALAFLAKADERPDETDAERPDFVLLLMLVGGLLVLGPEFVYLADQFGWRMNTVFKFYYQAWLLWSLAAAFGAGLMLTHLRGSARTLWQSTLVVVMGAGLLFSVFGYTSKTNNFNPPGGFSLDSAIHLERYNPEDAAAAAWLRAAPLGVVAEAVGGSYTEFARMATYSGQSTVLGWPGHESQWRGSYKPQGSRQMDIETLYSTRSWNEAAGIIAKYNIRYIVVGRLEKRAYPVEMSKFEAHLPVVFRQGETVIYQVP